MKEKRNGSIELLRIIAASCIILHHHQQETKIDFLPIAFYGGRFDFSRVVELFFLISGFFTYKSIENIDGNSNLIDYGKKKLIRFYPMLVVSVGVGFVLRKIAEINWGGASYGIFDLLINLMGLQQLGIFHTVSINYPTWYLSVLILCYLVFFLLTKWSKKKGINPFTIYVFVLIMASAIFTYSWDTVLINRSIARGLFNFFAGLFLAKYLSTKPKAKWELMITIIPVLFLIIIRFNNKWLQNGNDYLYTLMLWIPLVFMAVRYNPTVLSKSKTICLLGQASFSVYLLNNPLAVLRSILVKTESLQITTKGFLIAYFLFNWFIGIVSFLYLEKPLDEWIKQKMHVMNNGKHNEIKEA